MKEFMVSMALLFTFIYSMFLDMDIDSHELHRKHLKGVAEEVAASAAQYFSLSSYGDGFYNFNQNEGEKAANYTLQSSMRLTKENVPLQGAYWQDKTKVALTYIDYDTYSLYLAADATSTEPFPNRYTFSHFGETHTVMLYGPSVISSINAGVPNYALKLLKNEASDVVEHGIHTFKE
ncbi:hypothetical protein ACQKMI_24450 [Lysinibacillus sp. NPDC097214]|uniref:hypothetical protein n=1 Tax=Lysinibacillus sp. NPDC097214 TaxID=3390584 RepID=UPI003D03F6AF